MGWRDRVRRSRPPAAGNAGDAGSAPVERASAGVGVPEGWDGGWRAASTPELTVSRAPLAVSDGLGFRAGLAAWHDPSFDTGLAHGVLPSAPAGLVRGVARPASASSETFSGGGPLLLRAVRREEAEETAPAVGVRQERVVAARPRQGERAARSGSASRKGAGAGRSGAPAVQRRTAADPVGAVTSVGSIGSVEEQRGLTSSGSPAVLGAGEAPPVQRTAVASAAAPKASLPVVRRVAVVEPRSGGAASPGPVPTRPFAQTESVSAPSGSASGRAAAPATTSVRPLPVGRSLIVARRPAGPVRRVTPVATAAPKATAPTPQAERQPQAEPEPQAARAEQVDRATVQRREGSRPPLGEPLTQLPPTAVPMKQGAVEGNTAGPALPVVQSRPETTAAGERPAPSTEPVQRRAEAPAPRTRSGLGAPMSELPPTADVPGSRERSGRAPVQRSTAPAHQQPSHKPLLGGAAGADEPTPDAAVQRRTPTDSASTGTPADSTPLTVARPSAPVQETPGAPARPTPSPEGTRPAVQRAPASPAATPRTSQRPTLGAPERQGPVSPATAPDGQSPARPSTSGTASGTGQSPVPLTPARPGTSAPQASGTNPASVQPASVQRASARPSTPGTAPGTTSGAAPGTASGTGQGSVPLTPARPVRPTVRTARTDQHPAHPGTPAQPAPGTAQSGMPTRRGPGTPDASAPRTPGSSPASAPGTPAASAPRTPVRPRPTPGTTPLVVARAVTLTGQPAPTATAKPSPTLNLLPARPLTLSTEEAPPMAAPAQRRTAERPVVAARWAREPAAGTQQPSASVQRAPRSPVTPSPSRAARPTPLAATPSAPAPRPLPVTAPQPPAVQPFLVNSPAREATPAAPAPVVRPTRGGGPATADATPPLVRPAQIQRDVVPTAPTPTPPVVHTQIQRDKTGTTTPPAQGTPAAQPANTPSKQGKSSTRSKPAAAESSPDLDDLARRLLDPVSRLLRNELRRGRDRTGRPFDGRR
ncbi:hypothetical protein ACFV1A_10265 [Streptomyces seoulensis]|uniref:hypothetical protein n=1 Tax=Streptomyces seoulensis TaxID=73044 RepID=UPI0036BC1A9D